jgi:hypothetical protein
MTIRMHKRTQHSVTPPQRLIQRNPPHSSILPFRRTAMSGEVALMLDETAHVLVARA